MSETTTEGTPAPTPNTVAEAAAPGRFAGETPEQTIAALRETLAKANAEAKENRLAAKELEEVKKSQMSDLEKAQTSAQEYQKQAETFQREALRWRIAAKHGISDEDAETFLTGTDEESLNRQAERLAALNTSPMTPKPDRSQGGQGTPAALNSDGLEDALRSKLGI